MDIPDLLSNISNILSILVPIAASIFAIFKFWKSKQIKIIRAGKYGRFNIINVEGKTFEGKSEIVKRKWFSLPGKYVNCTFKGIKVNLHRNYFEDCKFELCEFHFGDYDFPYFDRKTRANMKHKQHRIFRLKKEDEYLIEPFPIKMNDDISLILDINKTVWYANKQVKEKIDNLYTSFTPYVNSPQKNNQ